MTTTGKVTTRCSRRFPWKFCTSACAKGTRWPFAFHFLPRCCDHLRVLRAAYHVSDLFCVEACLPFLCRFQMIRVNFKTQPGIPVQIGDVEIIEVTDENENLPGSRWPVTSRFASSATGSPETCPPGIWVLSIRPMDARTGLCEYIANPAAPARIITSSRPAAVLLAMPQLWRNAVSTPAAVHASAIGNTGNQYGPQRSYRLKRIVPERLKVSEEMLRVSTEAFRTTVFVENP